MRATRRLAWAMAGMFGLGITGLAGASTCYVVLDRTDAVIYRDVVPPYDLSDPKSPEHAAMRARGEHMLIAEFDKCEPAGFISRTTGGGTATVEDIVTQLKPAIAPSVGTRQGTRSASAPAAAPARSPAKSGY
jgi:hypothetical protein